MYIFKSRGDGQILLDEQMIMESGPNSSYTTFNLKSKMLSWKWFGLAITIMFICIGLIFYSTLGAPASPLTKPLKSNIDEDFINGQ